MRFSPIDNWSLFFETTHPKASLMLLILMLKVLLQERLKFVVFLLLLYGFDDNISIVNFVLLLLSRQQGVLHQGSWKIIFLKLSKDKITSNSKLETCKQKKKIKPDSSMFVEEAGEDWVDDLSSINSLSNFDWSLVT